MWVLVAISYLGIGIGLHAGLARLNPAGNRVRQFVITGGASGLALIVHAVSSNSFTQLQAIAAIVAYAFACELYIFLFTFVISSVSVALLLGGRRSPAANIPPTNMVEARLATMVASGLLEFEEDLYRLTARSHRLLGLYQVLYGFFRHPSLQPATEPQAARSRPVDCHPGGGGVRLVFWLVMALYLAPFIFAAVSRFECFAYANESIAYRWGHASRAAFGDVPPILPQGFTVFAAQQWIVKAAEWLQPPTGASLRQTLQLFSWSTFVLFSGLFTLTMSLALKRRTLTAEHIAAVGLPAMASFYGSGALGLYYFLLPDYYHLNVILGCAFTLFMIQVMPDRAGASEARPAIIVGLGIVLGLGLGNKVTWAVPCVFAFAAVLLAGPLTPRRLLARTTLLTASTLLVAVVVLLAYYRLDFAASRQGIDQWLAFMRGQEGSIKLWTPEFFSTIKRYNFDALFVLAALTLLVAIAGARGWRGRIVALTGLAGFCAMLWMISRRPASTSLWDVNALILASTAATAMLIDAQILRRGIIVGWVLAIGVLAYRNPPGAALPSIQAAKQATENRFAVFDQLNAFAEGRPQLILLRNNEYAYGGVHELLLKAASDFPTWNVSVGRPWLQRFADLTFVHDYGNPFDQLGDIDSGTCIVWFNRPDLEPLENVYPRLGQLLVDPRYEAIRLEVHLMNLSNPPGIQSIVRAVRLKPNGH